MGISGLYKWLDSIKRPEHVKTYAGKTLGIDTYSWLHKGAFSCAIELVQGTPTTRYIDYCVERIKMLQYHGIKPYLVFDGDYLPSKAGTEEGREARREESRQKGLALLSTNKSAAMDILQKAIDVTPLMARHVIEACKGLDVPYVVAPYEADAQLYYLEKTGVIDGVISEDSDLLVFGVRLLITKMGRLGDCIEVNRADFTRCKDISLAGWTDAEFRTMAILSGCDYLPSIRGIGVKKAHGYVRSHKTAERIVRSIRLDGKMSVPPDYLEKFKQAELTFLHQRVWCPTTDIMVMCTEPEEPLSSEALVFIGGEVEVEIARGVARGDLDPITKEPFDLSFLLKSTAKPTPSAPSILNTLLRPQKSIASFFAPSPAPRTPLQPKASNAKIIRRAFTAPRPTPPAKKRTIEESAKTDIPPKKSRLFGPDENVDATGERSSFFQAPGHLQSRRPLGDITTKSPLPVNGIKRPFGAGIKLAFGAKKGLSDLERAIKASLASTPAPAEKDEFELAIKASLAATTPTPVPMTKKGLDELELAIKASLSSEYLLPDDTPVQKVARSLKADFTFKAAVAPKKLARFVERQRAGGVAKPAQIPHTVGAGEESQDSAVGEGEWEGFELGESQGGSQTEKILGEGGFGRFMLRR